MPLGLVNAATIFQQIATEFRGHFDFARVYIHDIDIFANYIVE